MAIYGMVFLGSTPIGAVMIGWLAEHYGPRAGFVVGGVVAIIAGMSALWLRQRAIALEALPTTD
jgi:MFS family permease